MADEQRPLDDINQADLFKGAMEPAPEAPEPAVAEPQPSVAPPAPAPAPDGADGPIPSWRLREEAEARRLAETRARELEGRLNEVMAHIRQQPEPKKPDFFENPDAATQELLIRTLQPFAEETRRQMLYLGKMVASNVHGENVVDEAEQAFLRARNDESLDPMDYERVVQSPNRYDAVVKWHRAQAVLSSVGDDPAAYFDKTLETRLTDPKFQASLLEKIRGGAATRPSETRLPPSLSRVTAAASNAGEGIDSSDAGMFRYAMTAPKGRQ